MADCLIVGFHDVDFAAHEERVRSMGTDAGAYRDLALGFVRHEGRPLRALDVINSGRPGERLHNADFLWPVILVLGTSLHRRGHTFDYINLPHFEREAFREKLAAPDLAAVALTSTLYTEPQPLLELVAFIRAHNAAVPIVIGGPYVAGQAKVLGPEALAEQLRYLGGDVYVISAEGEQALGEVVSALKAGAPLDGIDNLAFRRGERLIFTKRSVEYGVLADNMVDYSLFPRGAFGEFVTTRTAKSCPFSCSFCGFPERAGEYTYLGVEDVEKELDAIAAIGGVTTLTVIDDTFNVPKKRFKDILRLMIRKGYGFRWNSFFRCDHGDEETIDLMAEAGCEGVILGVESGSDAILRSMNKTAKRSHYLQAIPRLEAAGIDCYASLIVGFPGETVETVQETIDLLETTRPSYYRAQLWYCDPITPIYRQRLLHGLRGEGFHWSHRTMNVDEACDHIDRLFLCVEGSIWQPQAGFELWSTFYLRRKGVPREQVRAFLRSFNGAVKEKLLRPRRAAELSAERARDLRRLSEIGAREIGPLEAPALSGAEYVAAERYWIEALRDLSADERTELVPREEPAFSAAIACDDAPGRDALVAVLAVVAGGLQGGFRVLLLGQDGADPELLPLYVPASRGMRLHEVAALVARARDASRRHRAFGLPILRRAIRLGYLGARAPRITAAYVETEEALRATLAEHPALGEEVRVVLERDGAGVVRVRTRLGAAMTTELARVVRSLLSGGGALALEEIAAGGALGAASVAASEPAFDFG